MRFRRHVRHPFTDTSRKRAALRRKQRLEREALPLLATLIAEQQPDEDSVMAERAVRWLRAEAETRARRALAWRKARARLRSFTTNEARALYLAWQGAPYPASPEYLLDFLHSYSVGRFTLDRLPFDPCPRDVHGCRVALGFAA